MLIEDNILRALLKNVYFFNGTAYAGKSTMVHLLAEKYHGIECGENYHDALMSAIDPEHQPNLSYISHTMKSWQEFVTRSPEAYHNWLEGCSREAVSLELPILLGLVGQGKPIFVDTNISVEYLKRISDVRHVAIMVSPPSMSVDRFFDRPDAEKQFIYQELMRCPDPEAALENYRAVLARVNSPENYRKFEESGFAVFYRREDSTIPEMLAALERHFGLAEEG